jgi:NADH-quinone oxidoreductase subunit F
MRVAGAALSPSFESDPSPGIAGCHGWCSQGPLVEIPDLGILYTSVVAADVPEIVERTVVGGEVIGRLLAVDPATGKRCRGTADNPFFSRQNRRVLARCGVVDPESIDHAVSLGAYKGLRRAIEELGPEQIIELVKRAGIQERGGAGFPVGLKWAVVAEAPAPQRFVIGTGESGDPGMTVDRTLLEGDPHGLIEGLVIAGCAVGASSGRLLVRSEHALGAARAERAVAEARRRGLLGPNIFSSSFSFDIDVRETAGVSMGGEETALLNTLQGRRAVARPRPPFPAVSGLWGRPTLINTLETLANIPLIVSAGDDDDAAEQTIVVSLSGAVARPGLAEVPLGAAVDTVVNGIGGGARQGRRLRAVHVGGSGGATVRADRFDLALDYASVRELDANLGSGSLIVLDDHACVLSFVRYLLEFCARESCGTCSPCRIGTQVMLNLLDSLASGRGSQSDLGALERLGRHIRRTSMCDLGRNAPVPLLTGLETFRDDFEAHFDGRGCPTGACVHQPRSEGADSMPDPCPPQRVGP